MKKILDKRNMTETDWQEYRKKQIGIGGSEVATILGLNPYKSAFTLWLEKTDQLEKPDINNQYIEWGNILEPVIRKHFKKVTGFKVFQNNFVLQHDKHDFMIANIDGEVIDPEIGERGILEIKTANERMKSEWEEGPPHHYMLQIQHYLAVTDYNYAYVACLIGGNTFKYFKIERDEYVIDKIISAESEFMEMVEKKIAPEISSSTTDSEWLARAYPLAIEEEATLSPALEELAFTYNELQKEIKELQDKATKIKNQIKLEAKENKIIKGDGIKISMPTIHKTIFDSKQFKEDYPDLYEKYKTKESSYRGFTVSLLK